MKKSTYIAMCLWIISGILFALGMCMALLPEWDAFGIGIGCGLAGMVLTIVTWLYWRKAEGKAPIHFGVKSFVIGTVVLAGLLAFGVGMCYCLVLNRMVEGICVGVVGILILLSVIPLSGRVK